MLALRAHGSYEESVIFTRQQYKLSETVNAYHQLWLNVKDDIQQEKRFPEYVKRSALNLWRPGDEILPKGMRILIGVATYSEYDMRLLDLMDAFVASSSHSQPFRVDVFSLQDCHSQHDIEQYIPNIGQVCATPVIGVWQDQRLTDKGFGATARQEFVVDSFDLDWDGQTWCWEKLASK